VNCLANACIDPGSAYEHMRPESTQPVALLGQAGPLHRLINAVRLFPQGPSRELSRHRAVTVW